MALPIDRILSRLDDYYGRDDSASAGRHLVYWLDEARATGDRRGLLTLLNEAMGYYRKAGDREKAFETAREALALKEELGLADTLSGATVCLNAATVCTAFDEAERALALYREALPVYEANLSADDERLGGLYNNMAASMCDLGLFDEGRAFYEKALNVMNAVPGSEPSRAITLLNLADALEAEQGAERAAEEIERLLDRATALFDSPSAPRDAAYAFAARKCAPVFDYYGFFAYAKELEERAEKIYAGN